MCCRMHSSATRVLPLAVGLARTRFFLHSPSFPFEFSDDRHHPSQGVSNSCWFTGHYRVDVDLASLYVHSDVVESVAHDLDCALRIFDGHLFPEKRAGPCLRDSNQPFELSGGYCNSRLFAGGVAHLQIEILKLLHGLWG